MSLSDSIAELTAMAQQQQAQPPAVPPPGSPGRPNIDLAPPPPKAAPAASPKAAPASPFERAVTNVSNYVAKGLQSVTGAVTDPNNLKAVGAGILRAPGQLVGGMADTLADADKFASDNIIGPYVRNVTGPGPLMLAASIARQANKMMGNGASLADTLSQRSTLGQVGNPDVNQMAAQGAAVALTLPGGAEGAASGLAAKVAPLLMNSLKVGAASAVTADTSGAPTAEAALKERATQGAEGAAINTVAEPLLGMISSYIKAKVPTKIVEGSPEDATSDLLDRGFASARTTEARYQAQEAQGKPSGADSSTTEAPDQALLQQGTRAADAVRSGSDAGADGGVRPTGNAVAGGTAGSGGAGGAADGAGVLGDPAVYQDANAALKTAGAAEKVAPDTHPIQPDGTIPVEPATKAAADDAGLGRAFAATDEGIPKDSVIFKEEDPQGGSRVVGIIDKDSLQGFKDDVDANRFDAENPADTTSEHPVGQWKLGNLGAPYDVQPFLRAMADQLPQREALTDADVMSAAKANADAIGWSHEDMIAYASSVAGDAKQLPEVMATIRTIYTRAASQVDVLLDTKTDWSALPDNHPKLNDALSAVHNVVTLGQSAAEFKSGVGGALRMAGMPDADAYMESFGKTPQADLKPVNPLDGLPKLPRNQQELQQWLDAWDYTKGDPIARDTFIKGLTFMPGKWMQLRTSFANFFTAGIISGPATFLRDALGPAIISGLRTLERTTGGYAAAYGNPFLDAATKADLLRSASQAPMAYAQTLGAVADALKAGVRATTEGNQLLQPHGLYDLRTRTVPDSLIEAATGKPPGLLNAGSYPYVLANAINVFPGWIHALHGGVNEFAQRLSYLGEVRASAMLEAAQQGLTGDDATAHVVNALRNSTDEVTWAGNNQAALASSQRTTLIKPVGGENQPIVSKFNDFISALRTNFPESRFVLPIFTVPANAIGEGIRRIPVLNLAFAETRSELAGEAGAPAQAEAYGRTLSGAAMLLGGLAMARAGVITGAGPPEPNARAAWEDEGMQPYSIRLGGKWISYNRLDVVGNLLAIPAAIYDRSVHTQMDNQSAAFAGVAALAQYFKDQAALQGISDLMSFGGSPNESEGFLTKLVKQTAGGLVPNAATQVLRNNIDPDKRVTRNWFEAILDKLPGTSTMLDPQRNIYGQPSQKIANAGAGMLPITVTTANTYAKDPTSDEVDRLYKMTGYAPGLLSPALPGGKEDMRDIKLEDGTSLYDALMRYRGIVTDDMGQHIKPALQSLFDSPEYNQAVDGNAHNLKTTNGDDDRGAMVAKLFHQFDTEAQHEVAQASPIAARYLAVGQIKNGNNAFLRDTPTSDLVTNPALLKALGIDVTQFEDKVRGQ